MPRLLQPLPTGLPASCFFHLRLFSFLREETGCLGLIPLLKRTYCGLLMPNLCLRKEYVYKLAQETRVCAWRMGLQNLSKCLRKCLVGGTM